MSSLARTGTSALDALALAMPILCMVHHAIAWRLHSGFAGGRSQFSAAGEEIFHGTNFPSALERRQALPDAPPITLGNQARIANHQHAAITLVADQSACPLLQIDDRRGQL